MELYPEEIDTLREEIGKNIKHMQEGREPEMSATIELLSSGQTSLVYRIWEYADRQKLDNHPREFGYRDPEEIMESLRSMETPDRNNVRELVALRDYSLSNVRDTLED